MERRVQLQNFKQKVDLPSIDITPSLKTLDSEAVPDTCINDVKLQTQPTTEKTNANVASQVPDSFPSSIVKDEATSSDGEPPKKRIKTLLPVKPKPPPLSLATRRRRSMKSSDSEPEELVNQRKSGTLHPSSDLLDDLINQAVQEGAIITVADANLPHDKIFEASVVLEPCLVPIQVDNEVKIEQANEGTKIKQSEKTTEVKPPDIHEKSPIEDEHKRIREVLTQKPPHREPAYMKKEALLTTEESYVTLVGEPLGPHENMYDTIGADQTHVEVCA